MLVKELVETKWSGQNRKHYESLGYVYSKEKEPLVVKVEHLMDGSNVPILYTCDVEGCGKQSETKYKHYKKRKISGIDHCADCSNKQARIKSSEKFVLASQRHAYRMMVRDEDYRKGLTYNGVKI